MRKYLYSIHFHVCAANGIITQGIYPCQQMGCFVGKQEHLGIVGLLELISGLEYNSKSKNNSH